MLKITDSQTVDLNYFKGLANTICFCGEVLDDRGKKILKSITSNGSLVIPTRFNIDNYRLRLGYLEYPSNRPANSIERHIEDISYSCVIIEATTIGFVELLLLLKWFLNSDINEIKIIYAEPEQYKSRVNYMNDFGRHEFDLSTHSDGFRGVQGFTKVIPSNEKSLLVALLGFERARLGHLLQEDEGAFIDAVLPIFGTPGYRVGWDKHSFVQNIETIADLSTKPQFVSAVSPLDTYNRLSYVSECYPEKTLMVAPFGTKPLSIGAAVFLINNFPQAVLKYDHPSRKKGRSNGIGNIHMYTVKKHDD